jgi:bifunctional non-homologous end joining protein LigD
MVKLLALTQKAIPASTIFFFFAEPCYFAFDLLFLNGNDCRRHSLSQRKLALRQLVNSGKFSGAIYVDHVETEGAALHSRVCELDGEGIVAKHNDSPYLSETTVSTWYKMNCSSANATGNQYQVGTDVT